MGHNDKIVVSLDLSARDVDRLVRALDRASHGKRDSIEWKVCNALAGVVPEHMPPYVILALMEAE